MAKNGVNPRITQTVRLQRSGLNSKLKRGSRSHQFAVGQLHGLGIKQFSAIEARRLALEPTKIDETRFPYYQDIAGTLKPLFPITDKNLYTVQTKITDELYRKRVLLSDEKRVLYDSSLQRFLVKEAIALIGQNIHNAIQSFSESTHPEAKSSNLDSISDVFKYLIETEIKNSQEMNMFEKLQMQWFLGIIKKIIDNNPVQSN